MSSRSVDSKPEKMAEEVVSARGVMEGDDVGVEDGRRGPWQIADESLGNSV